MRRWQDSWSLETNHESLAMAAFAIQDFLPISIQLKKVQCNSIGHRWNQLIHDSYLVCTFCVGESYGFASFPWTCELCQFASL